VTLFPYTTLFRSQLTADAIGVISGGTITIALPLPFDRSSLKASFTTTGSTVTLAGIEQQSGQTINDFRTPVVYTVNADDGSTQSYDVDASSKEVRLQAPDGIAGDEFGVAVALSADYGLVGAWKKASAMGSAYVFQRNGSSGWDSVSTLKASDAGAGDSFGLSVAISGDYAIIGAPDKASSKGAAYIFHRISANTWDAGIKLTAYDGLSNDRFGFSVALCGDYAIVGAAWNASAAGAAYVFHRTGSNTWDAGTKLVSPVAVSWSLFVWSVSMSGDIALVGECNSGSLGSQGLAYAFERTGLNTWDAGTELQASDAAGGDRFGESVSMDGNIAVIGANKKASAKGATYIFQRTGTGVWDSGTKLQAPSPVAGDMFGYSVCIVGETVMVGAKGRDENKGRVYLFQKTGVSSWTATAELIAGDRASDDCFGTSVSMSGDNAIVGANGKSSNQGIAYLYSP
jgi:hypothetical protein